MAQHKLFIYPDADARASLARVEPVETLVFADLEAAIAAAQAHLDATRDPFAVQLDADPDAIDLDDYVRASNVVADWLEANPIERYFVSRVDADHYREVYGVKTARELDDQLFWQGWSDAYKSATGCRPGYRPDSRAEAERILDGLYSESV